MRRTWRKAKPKEEKKFYINRQIRVPEVFLIGDGGEQIGVTETEKAIQMAKDLDLDLVEVNPRGKPPVAKIMNFGQFKYEQEKKAHKQSVQQKKVETKGIRLSVRISVHDFDFRLNQAKKFLDKENKLKLEIILKGREKAHPEKAAEVLNKFVSKLEEDDSLSITREQDLTRQGGRYSIILINKK